MPGSKGTDTSPENDADACIDDTDSLCSGAGADACTGGGIARCCVDS